MDTTRAAGGVWVLGSQFLEPGEEKPLRLDRQQWVRDLEWRGRVPDDLVPVGAKTYTENGRLKAQCPE